MVIKIRETGQGFKSFFANVQEILRQVVQHQIEAQLEAEVEAYLHRRSHARRSGVHRRTQAKCRRCGSREAHAFSRNGHRQRELVTSLGVVKFWLPRVVCACGGSVHIPFSILQPYQRLWADVLAQIERWAQWGVSLRQMQAAIGDELSIQVGLRKLNEVVHQVVKPTDIELTSVPPIVMLDAIWVTLLEDTPERKKDTLKRQRTVKERQKVCILVALGLYPQTQHWGILGWGLAASESQEAWEQLLLPLEARGVYRQRGVELFIHDGGKGLVASLDLMYPNIPHQRCLFHKLRNLWQAIQTPDGLSREQRRDFKRELLQLVTPILYADSLQEAQQLRDRICAQWQDTQTAFVDTLKRDWHETIAFFRVLARYPDWPRTSLRTTSLLERINRILRRLFRSAGAYHSRAGLLATVARVLGPMLLI